ncbi:RNA-guided endonuclease TnpB family protein [Pleurocapsa sp. PCC 7319]|uniref:RNA-guided endonuclease InsQ/TnpB family protein n=1 Tax=Pleurocapsa sp. PCC 7319 TaxID=118161 RepID=UPI0004765BA8|nr:RNA-guided endonuclease TnpB family protein [Pleurocapsa sp. PCC 7319]
MKTYKFKLYQHKRNRHLHRTINAAGHVYNHCIALHKRYYSLFGKHLNKNKLMKHIAQLRHKNEYWQLVGSQAVQNIVQRIDRAYQLFFKHHQRGVRPPNFRKRIKYKSFTLKQAGYKFLDSNRLRIGKRIFKFWKSREIEGKIKTVTIKRNPLGELFVFVVTDCADQISAIMTGKSAGFDFGLKVFLSCSDSTEVKSPFFLKQSLKQLASASRKHSHKKRGSNSKEKARQNLVRVHEKVVNRRADWFWKLAHQLTDKLDYLFFETLNLKGMQRLWGRKIGDLALAQFLKILEFVAEKKGKIVSYIDRWYPSTKTCSECYFVIDKLGLNERYWVCPSCSTKHGRDSNASQVILRVGASTLRVGNVSLSQTAISA